MKKLTTSQQDILDNLALLSESDLTLNTPFHIARRGPCWFTWDRYGKEQIPTQFVQGYARSADGLVQRGILIRDKGEVLFWLTTFGIEYIKGLKA